MVPKTTHRTGTADADTRVNSGAKGHLLAQEAASPMGPVGQIPPRLLGLEATARYLDVSPWTVRTLEAAGLLPRIHIPMPPLAQTRPRNGRNGGGSGELRKLLFDRADLDQCIEKWKEKAGDNRL